MKKIPLDWLGRFYHILIGIILERDEELFIYLTIKVKEICIEGL